MLHWTAIAVVCIPLLLALGYALFDSWREFGAAFVFLLMPWWAVALSGNWVQGNWLRAKMLMFILASVIIVVSIHAKFGAQIDAWLR